MLVRDKLRSYGAAKAELGLSAHHEQGLRKNNRDENYYVGEPEVRVDNIEVGQFVYLQLHNAKKRDAI